MSVDSKRTFFHRWFHDGCCECVGSTCLNYGLHEGRCQQCPISKDMLHNSVEPDDEIVIANPHSECHLPSRRLRPSVYHEFNPSRTVAVNSSTKSKSYLNHRILLPPDGPSVVDPALEAHVVPAIVEERTTQQTTSEAAEQATSTTPPPPLRVSPVFVVPSAESKPQLHKADDNSLTDNSHV